MLFSPFFAALPAAAAAAPSPWLVLPFVALLLAIVVGPLAFHARWERFYPRLVLGLVALAAGYYFIVAPSAVPLGHAAQEYVSFVALIGSLYVVAGGIHLRVKGEATPARNCGFLLAGAVLANVIGTTGASMLLIRPWLRMNKYRVTAHHVVFFIFIVSNVGGCLTPIGDPPLFLGFLKGVPFWWVPAHLWSAWLVGVSALLAVFFVWDQINFLRAPKAVRTKQTAQERWGADGTHNVAFLVVILVGVFLPFGARETVLACAAAGSWLTTRRSIYEANDFNLHPMREVAWLFAGIFATMAPALQVLEHHAPALGLRNAFHFYWSTGLLSGVLDNAPTYLAFLATAFGLNGLSLERPGDMARFLAEHGLLLEAISVAAVFFGAMTYIGNGPNFMVKAIAEQQKVQTPGFLGYLFRYAVPVLGPLLALVGLLFFSRWRIFN